jgi:hypothetical protein
VKKHCGINLIVGTAVEKRPGSYRFWVNLNNLTYMSRKTNQKSGEKVYLKR